MIQEEIDHEPTITQQKRVIQQHVGMVGEMTVSMIHEHGSRAAAMLSLLTALATRPGKRAAGDNDSGKPCKELMDEPLGDRIGSGMDSDSGAAARTTKFAAEIGSAFCEKASQGQPPSTSTHKAVQ
eukprot:3474585-Heterocapsa_arctica.AAC.1